MADERDPLLNDIEGFLEAAGMSPTAFGEASLGDPRFVFDLRAGRECRRATRQRVREFMANAARSQKDAAA